MQPGSANAAGAAGACDTTGAAGELRHPIDLQRLAGHLAANLPGFEGPLTASQFEGGQSNPTYLLRTPARRYVLRRKPPGQLLPSAHAVDREYRVMRALRDSGVPVPGVLLHCTDSAVIGTEFFVMEFLDGRLFWNPALPGLSREERGRIYDEMNRVISTIHRLDVGVAGLGDFGKPGRYVSRQIERWTRQYRSSETGRIEPMERLIEWLPANVPPGEETSLVHGDFRLDNLVFDPKEARVIGVLDWELSTLGHPLVDFAYHAMAWRVPGNVFRGLAEADLAELGIPDEVSYVRRYCERVGRDGVEHWNFYLAFNLFRIAAILQGVMARALKGNAASAHALHMGRQVAPLADIGWSQATHAGS